MKTARNGFTTVEEAEEAFYQAFQLADLDRMMAVWVQSEHIACIHPMGKIQRGQQAVQDGWIQIFSAGQRMHFEILLQQQTIGETLVSRTVQESIYLHGENHPRPPIMATNVYQLTEAGWRMILHHASPAVLANEEHVDREKHPVH